MDAAWHKRVDRALRKARRKARRSDAIDAFCGAGRWSRRRQDFDYLDYVMIRDASD